MKDVLLGLGQSRTCGKGDFLFRQGGPFNWLCLVKTGLAKAFYETRDGKEYIKSFIKAGELISSLQALVNDKPCSFSVSAIEPCEVVDIPRHKVLEMMQNPEYAQSMNGFLLSLAQKKERREFEFLCLSADERYLLFCEREPELVGRITQIDIARYLGITPVALSRIKKRVSG